MTASESVTGGTRESLTSRSYTLQEISVATTQARADINGAALNQEETIWGNHEIDSALRLALVYATKDHKEPWASEEMQRRINDSSVVHMSFDREHVLSILDSFEHLPETVKALPAIGITPELIQRTREKLYGSPQEQEEEARKEAKKQAWLADLSQFIVRANLTTWAGDGKEVSAQRPGKTGKSLRS